MSLFPSASIAVFWLLPLAAAEPPPGLETVKANYISAVSSIHTLECEYRVTGGLRGRPTTVREATLWRKGTLRANLWLVLDEHGQLQTRSWDGYNGQSYAHWWEDLRTDGEKIGSSFGRIERDKDNGLFGDFHPDRVTGESMFEGDYPLTTLFTTAPTPTMSWDTVGETRCVKLSFPRHRCSRKLAEPNMETSVWLDPAAGYLPRRIETLAYPTSREPSSQPPMKYVLESHDFQAITGGDGQTYYWPMTGVYSSRLGDSELKVSRIRINEPIDSQVFEPTFPAGATVTEVLPNGRKLRRTTGKLGKLPQLKVQQFYMAVQELAEITPGEIHELPEEQRADAALLGLTVDQQEQRIEGPPSSGGKLSATYQLRNTSSEVIELGAIIATCGCTPVAPVTSQTLAPGEALPLTVSAHAPVFGARKIEVRVHCSVAGKPAQLDLDLDLTLCGEPYPADFVAEVPWFLELEAVKPGTVVREFSIQTSESDATTPWISRWKSDDPRVQVEVLRIEEWPGKSVAIVRKYHCRMTATIDIADMEWQTAIVSAVLTRQQDKGWRLDLEPAVRGCFRLRQPWVASPALLLTTAGEAVREPLRIVISAATMEDVASLSALEVVSTPKGAKATWVAGSDPSERVLEVTFTAAAPRESELILSAPDLPSRLIIPCRQAVTTADANR